MEKLQVAEENVKELMDLLEEKRKQLNFLEAKLESLRQRFAVSFAEKSKLEGEQVDCSMKLKRAEKLISEFV